MPDDYCSRGYLTDKQKNDASSVTRCKKLNEKRLKKVAFALIDGTLTNEHTDGGSRETTGQQREGAHTQSPTREPIMHLGITAMSQVNLKSKARYDSFLKRAIERAREALE